MYTLQKLKFVFAKASIILHNNKKVEIGFGALETDAKYEVSRLQGFFEQESN
jgi:hypothetical protein